MTRNLTAIVLIAASVSVSAAARAQRASHSAHATPTHTAAADTTAIKNVFWQPNALAQGSPAFFTVELEKPATRVTATWPSRR